MLFSIIIPTFNNFKYFKVTIESILKNSSYKHEIITHINGVDNETEEYLKKENLPFTKSEINIGLCSGVNTASKLSSTDFILYSHDDMYFLPDWDKFLENELKKFDHNLYYLSLTQISHLKGKKNDLQHIHFDCGSTINTFDKSKLLNNYNKFDFIDLQGSHWAPHLIHKTMWKKIGGFSEEFNPGFASDPDLNFKLWNEGVRVFKGVSKSRIYHFGSVTTRNNQKIKRNNGKKTFLLKWGISINFFTKYYLRRGSVFKGPLQNPHKNLFYYLDLVICKIQFFLAKFFS